MCGITGYIDFNNTTPSGVLDKMVKTIAHRGPDDCGSEIFNLSSAQIGLGHTRLSIIDLSSCGHQPMHFKDLCITYNGEIYNYLEIKKELVELGHKFNTGSDTEVILHAYDEWGIKAVDRFIGMFAIVLFDKKKEEIILIRDRAGVKPLYYYFKDGIFIFGSELKSFHKHPGFKKEIDLSALSLYFDFGYIPSPFSIFKNCFKLEPGHYLNLRLSNQELKNSTYWDVRDFYKKDKLKLSYPEAKRELHEILESAFKYRMVSDVPVGVFLSGGYDSTAVAALLQRELSGKLKTFTIGFSEGNNEAPFAQASAKYIGTDHTEFYCTTTEAQSIIPKLSYYYDEPFADSSAIPTMLISKLAREQVTVALSADGGDELFAGYYSYVSLWQKMDLINRIPPKFKGNAKFFFAIAEKLIPDSKISLTHKINSVSKALNTDNNQQAIDLFRMMNSLPESYRKSIFNQSFEEYTHGFYQESGGYKNAMEIVLAANFQMYLQNDILTKVDRATMSVALEGREPLLDHRLVEFAAQIPFEYKSDGHIGKRILKDILHEYVPQSMMNRPKSGFSLPINNWLKNDLSYLIKIYLNEKALSESGLFNTNFITNLVKMFENDKLHYNSLIWRLLMFQMWYKEWM
ncbi:MAG: asparagine synthase (glutamine-hydrolyzing) [Bacteroidetes bacterium]|nr:asparagine synthase (glutamine-hydrolyzing) [Bacteroidota bacterium]